MSKTCFCFFICAHFISGFLFAQKDNTVSYILVDGLSTKVFQDQLERGKLPRIEALMGKSTSTLKGVGSFPSMSGYGYYPFITGKKAIESDILGLRWFDRSLDRGNLRNYVGRTNVYMNRDINPDIKTVFEYFPNAYTTSINSFMNRGVKEESFTSWPLTTAKFSSLPLFKAIKKIPIIGDRHSYTHFEHESKIMAQAIEQLRQNPKVQFINLPGLDALHHIEGMNDNYPLLLQHIDHLVGMFLDTVAALGQEDERMIVLISDHGVSDVEVNHNVPYFLDSLLNIRLRRGASTSIRKRILDDPLSELDDVDGYYVVNGDLIGFIYLRDPDKTGLDSWRYNLNYKDLMDYQGLFGSGNIIQGLSILDGISFLAYCKGDTVCLSSAEGSSRISKVEGQFLYQVKDVDPLNYPQRSHNILLSEENWLSETIDLEYPMAIPKIFDLMTHPNMGDILLCTKEGYDLAADYEILVGNYKGGHGDLRANLILAPYIIYQPAKEALSLPYLTAVDVGKMVFEWLGIQDTEN